MYTRPEHCIRGSGIPSIVLLSREQVSRKNADRTRGIFKYYATCTGRVVDLQEFTVPIGIIAAIRVQLTAVAQRVTSRRVRARSWRQRRVGEGVGKAILKSCRRDFLSEMSDTGRRKLYLVFARPTDC